MKNDYKIMLILFGSLVTFMLCCFVNKIEMIKNIVNRLSKIRKRFNSVNIEPTQEETQEETQQETQQETQEQEETKEETKYEEIPLYHQI